MSEFQNQNTEWRGRNAAEGREVQMENKEKQPDEQEKKAAARERAEVVSKEVRSAKKQMQNIMANMQQVVKTVQAIRAQLQLSDSGAIPSVQRDEKNIEILKKKLANLRGELGDLRVALIIELKKEIVEKDKNLSESEVDSEAEKLANLIFAELELD
ncbi:MAG: hypothetical protein ACD_72C00504G0002 [uncultured bacterium]|nr:MAG: hypothetical protein ACD_72C00504G0002 [uncultured bacterium]